MMTVIEAKKSSSNDSVLVSHSSRSDDPTMSLISKLQVVSEESNGTNYLCVAVRPDFV